MVLTQPNVFLKIQSLESEIHNCLRGVPESVPTEPARDILVMPVELHPKKPGLNSKAGQARLLHDLASIELQAMELALRSLIEFREVAPNDFLEQLALIAISERDHLNLCLQALSDLGFEWGHAPVHNSLWQATSSSDSLLDRIMIVHRYLEGSGLDAGQSIMNKLTGAPSAVVQPVVATIMKEEVDHVLFGSNWYFELCRRDKIDPETDFSERLNKIKNAVPRRLEKIARDVRRKAGFTESEIVALESLREEFLSRVLKSKYLN